MCAEERGESVLLRAVQEFLHPPPAAGEAEAGVPVGGSVRAGGVRSGAGAAAMSASSRRSDTVPNRHEGQAMRLSTGQSSPNPVLTTNRLNLSYLTSITRTYDALKSLVPSPPQLIFSIVHTSL